MNFLFAISYLYFWSPIGNIAMRLCEQGNAIKLLLDKSRHWKWSGRFLFDSRTAPYSFERLKPRLHITAPLITTICECLNYAACCKLRQPTSKRLMDRWAGYIFRPLRYLTYSKWGRALLNAGFLELTQDCNEAVDVIQQIINGIDNKEELGIGYPNHTDIVAQAIENVASGKSP